jgi:transmembrane sensor
MRYGKPNRQIAEEAADWAVRLDVGALSETDRHALARWLAASPAHVDELLFAASIFSAIEHVDGGKKISIEDLLAAQAPDVLPLFSGATVSAAANDAGVPDERFAVMSGSLARWIALAGVVVLVAASAVFLVPALWTPGQPSAIVYHTETGEQRSLTLGDGSIVHLNTSSQISVTLARDERRIDLLSGEALFEVAHDKKRPFSVYADNVMSQAVGTKFNVQRDKGGVHIVVVEGRVLVRNGEPAQFSGGAPAKSAPNEVLVLAGSRVDVEHGFVMPKVGRADISEVALWRMRQLSFEKQTLAAIAAEFNRYNRVQMVVADTQLAEARFSGEFSSNDPESFLAFLELTPGINIDRSDAERVVLTLRKP